MKYSEEELNIINEKRADLRKKPEPSTNTAIIEFIKKYELASKLPKNLTSQEWFSLKQKVLDHKDFPKFQTVYFNEITEHNQKINKKLEDPKMEKELDFLIKKYSISERIRQFTNPLPPYSKYKVREGKKLNIFDMFLWSIFVMGLSIVLIISIF